MSRFIFPLALLLAFYSARAGDGFGNGGGLSEQNFLYGWTKLGDLVHLCLGVSSCGLAPDERAYLVEVETGFKAEYEGGGLLFKVLGDSAPLAQTEARVGAPILLNQSVLYPLDVAGAPAPYSVAQAVGVFVETLASHHRMDPRAPFVANAARKVSFLTGMRVEEQSLAAYGRPWVRFLFLDPSLILTDGERFEELAPYFSAAFECPAGMTLDGFRFSGVYWEQMPEWRGDGIQLLRIGARFSADCRDWGRELALQGKVLFHSPFSAVSNWRSDPGAPFELRLNETRVEFEDVH